MNGSSKTAVKLAPGGTVEKRVETFLYKLLAGVLAGFMFLPEFYFGSRLIVELVIVTELEPNYLVLITYALLTSICYGFAVLLIYFYRMGWDALSPSENWDANTADMLRDGPILLDCVFIFFGFLHLVASGLILGVLSNLLIMDAAGLSLRRFGMDAVLVILVALMGRYLLQFVDLPTRPFGLIYVPLVLYQIFLWVWRDFFQISPMAFDSWVLSALVLFALDALLIAVFTFTRESAADSVNLQA